MRVDDIVSSTGNRTFNQEKLMNETTLYGWAGIAIILALIIAYTIVFKKVRKKLDIDHFEDEESESIEVPEVPETAEGHEEVIDEPDAPNPDKVFGNEVSIAPAEGLGFEKAGADQSVEKNIRFEENFGKDKVVVEIPDPAKVKKQAAALAAQRKAAKQAPIVASIVGKKRTPEELVEELTRKIARRIDILKVAGLSQEGDRTLARYRENLAALEQSIAERNAQEAPVEVLTEAAEPVKVAKPRKASTAKKAVKKTPTRKTTKTTKKPAVKKEKVKPVLSKAFVMEKVLGVTEAAAKPEKKKASPAKKATTKKTTTKKTTKKAASK